MEHHDRTICGSLCWRPANLAAIARAALHSLYSYCAWFSVLFGVYEQGLEITGLLNGLMLLVGVVFVVNSLDSLTRLYTGNLNWSVDELGMRKYVTFHWLLLYTLILLYRFTPFRSSGSVWLS